MIVGDTSALLAVVFGEPDYAAYADVLDAEHVLVSSASLVESSIVVEARQGPDGARDLLELVDTVVDEIVPLDALHVGAAVDAWRRFGKGRHPAGLNFGDCLAYATAKVAQAPLLFKGHHFEQTDVVSAL